MTQLPPALSQQQYGGRGHPARRPASVVAAVLLMGPAFATWLFAGFGFLVVTARTEGDTGRILLWILAVAILALCLLLAYMTAVGAVQAWRGRSTRLTIPAGFTTALFFIAVINLIVQGKISYTASQLVPLIVGGMAGAALILLNSRGAAAWLSRLR